MCKILLVEDDIEISTMLQNFLKTENFQVIPAYDGESACIQFQSDSFSLVLLDLMIPKISGMEVMSRIRTHSTVPIIILSAKDTDSDKTLGLGLGADDYITKPFSVAEVLARIKANIRRNTQYTKKNQSFPIEPDSLLISQLQLEETKDKAESSQPILKKGNLILNPNEYIVTKNGRTLSLTAKEFDILKLFMQHPKKVYTKEQIYSRIWNDAYLGDENAVNVHISRLRSKIEDNPREPQYILTVWGIGYKLGDVEHE